ncbi:Lipase, class 3 [Cordyceps militaris CM01]|uniref:Lipase, class 3 n=1 Tax=Cordyceps militaris (strain CM01) TaxID=983644 RepID=G3JT37_CORMM|nr:Lipase, class 3 [Cordyceps militaris CM01]EGX89033.1 Lipase, class 3 [Cordyceps militaris CM01]
MGWFSSSKKKRHDSSPSWNAAAASSSSSPPAAGMSRWADSVMVLADSAVRDVYDDMSTRLDDVMTRIDRETVSAAEAGRLMRRHDDDDEQDLLAYTDRSLGTSSLRKSSRFAKVELYANSKLPLDLPPLALYMPTWPLLCLAAQHSSDVYKPSSSSSEESYSASDWRAGTKAMCIKSVPMDHASTIIFAIRGTSSFMDWAVNLSTEPSSPDGFLDDPGNLCHAGFLAVARNMVRPVAARLRRLLAESPGRAAYSLLITGHSAGGAIAALLYMHMLATAPGTGSELNLLAGFFKRIHCVTFGAPPVTLLPLQKPSPGGANPRRLTKCLFLAFVNEGDPVARADTAYVRSLLELLTKPPPERELLPDRPALGERTRWRSDGTPRLPRRRYQQVHWPVPACTLSNAGRIVVLRSGDPMASPGPGERTVEDRLAEGVRAQTCDEAVLRGVIWGDPVAHMMGLYAARIETLAVAAVKGQR